MKVALATIFALSLAVTASCSSALEARPADDLPDILDTSDDVDDLAEFNDPIGHQGATTTTPARASASPVMPDSPDVPIESDRTVVIGEISAADTQVIAIDVSPATDQTEFLSDNHLTYAEYQAAFQAYSNCVRTAGHDFHSVWTDEETGEITATVRNESLAVTDQCYYTHFADVDRYYQTTNPAVLRKRRMQDELTFEFIERPCLEDNGVVIPEGMTALEDDEALFRKWIFLDMDGLCADRPLPPEVLDQLQS